MASQNIVLKPVVREDVTRLREWLTHEEVSESWFGRYSYGDPAHLGYHPDEMAPASDHELAARVQRPRAPNPLGLHWGRRAHRRGPSGRRGVTGRRAAVHSHRALRPVAPGLRDGSPPRRARDGLQGVRSVSSMGGYPGVQRSCPRPVPPGRLRPRGHPAQEPRPMEGSRFDSVVMGMLAAEYKQRTAGSS